MSYTIKEKDTALQREIYADTKQDILDALNEIFSSQEGVAYWPYRSEYDDEVEQNARKTMSKVIEEIKNKDLPNLTNVKDSAGNKVIYYILATNQYYMKDYSECTAYSFVFYITRVVKSNVLLNHSSFTMPDVEQWHVPFLSVSSFGIHWAENPLDHFVKIAQEPLVKTVHWGKWGDHEWTNIRPTIQFNTREIIGYIDRMTKGCGVPQEEIDNIDKYIISLNLPDLTDCYAIGDGEESFPCIYATAIGVGYERGYGSIRIYHGISPCSFDEQFAYEGGVPFDVDDDENFKDLALIAQFPITDNLNYFDDRTDDTYFQRYARENLPFLYREKQLKI